MTPPYLFVLSKGLPYFLRKKTYIKKTAADDRIIVFIFSPLLCILAGINSHSFTQSPSPRHCEGNAVRNLSYACGRLEAFTTLVDDGLWQESGGF